MPDRVGWWEQGPARPPEAPIPWKRLVRPRLSRAEAVVSLLTLMLGFALAVSVHSHDSTGPLASARQEDLATILDDLDNRAERLRQEVSTLSQTNRNLTSGKGGASAAISEARTRAQQLAILAGQIGATGPGIVLRITDPKHSVRADVLVDAIEELRDAGAEAIEISGVRIVASSYVLDAAEGLSIDGTPISAPYVVTAIGDGKGLATALTIPGGIVNSVDALEAANATIDVRAKVTIASLQGKPSPQYAQSGSSASPSGTASP